MALKEQTYSVLVVSSVEKFNSALETVLPETSFQPVSYVGNIAAAQRMSAEQSFDFIIVNSPLPDDSGLHFAIDCSTSGSSLVLLLVRNEVYADVFEKVERHGVFTLPKPVSKQAIEMALRWMTTAKNRFRKVETKTTKMENKMEEIRLVNKAKWLLISKRGLLEPEAHRYIEKEAMDRCVQKRVIAEEIISQYQ